MKQSNLPKKLNVYYDMSVFTIHDLPIEERPRERLRKVGVENLSVQELLALIIGNGKRGTNVLTLAANLLGHFGSPAKIKEASLSELQEVPGVGPATASRLTAAFKLGEKAMRNFSYSNQVIDVAGDVYLLLRDEIGDKKQEHFRLLSLGTRKELISADKIFVGTVDASLAHPREIFRSAIKNAAYSVILVHNHPSGNPEPSLADEKITRRILTAGEVVGIHLTDHIIITKTGYLSFKEEGLI